MWLDNLRVMKEQSKLTTKEIAEQSNIPEPTLEKLFAGTTKDPRLATMQQLVHFLGYTLNDLDNAPNTAKESPDVAETAQGEKHLIELYRELNEEGQNLVVDYTDTLVVSGKYIKSDTAKLGKAKDE